MRRSAYGNILEIASFAGKVLLENGAEIYRVEQTARHICLAFGLKRCECFAAPTTIMLSIVGEDGEVHSIVRRIAKRSVNLKKIELVNEFSRNIGRKPPLFEELKAQMEAIDRTPAYPLPLMSLVAAVGTAAFTVVFGGSRQDFGWGFLSGALIHLLVAWSDYRGAGPFLTNLLGGAGCAVLGRLLTGLGWGGDWWNVTLSSLMLLVPGMLMTNGIRDLAAGDILSGLSRGAEALCIAASLAGGAAAVIFVLQWGGI